ncbi:MAG: rhomboid family intramembrane serine protease [Myxococcota bacterium]
MFVFVPLGVEGGEVRFPVVGASILAVCVVLFFATWVLADDPMGIDEATAGEAIEYLVEHPYLEPPPEFSRRFLPDTFQQQFASLREAWLLTNDAPSEEVQADQQAELQRLADAAIAAVKPTLFTRLALVKERGLAQVGWLTHMFLHFGWLHLLGNMLFLYAVALVLEDAWGRGLFLGFYLVGGLVSAAAEFALHGDSAMVMAGASGAVAACIGAAMVRFASRRMRLGYFVFLGFFFRTGTFAVPMWLWGLFKAGGEVLDLATGATQGVAVMAHVAGLSFGVLVALVMKGAGLDKQLVATDEATDPYRPSQSPALLDAQAFLARGQVAEARDVLEKARRTAPDDPDITWALMGVDLQEGRKSAAALHLERLVQGFLRAGHKEVALQRFTAAWSSFQPQNLRPTFAWLMVRTFNDEEMQRAVLRALAKRAGSEKSSTSAEALLRAAELALKDRDEDDAVECLDRAAAEGRLRKELSARLEELRGRLGPRNPAPLSSSAEGTLPEPGGEGTASPGGGRAPSGALPEVGAGLDLPPLSVGHRESSPSGVGGATHAGLGAEPDRGLELPGASLKVARQRRTFRAAVTAVRGGAVEVTLESGVTRALAATELAGLGAGLVLSADGRKVLVLLLVVRAGDEATPAILVRLDSDTAGVERLRPGVPVNVAYTEFLRWLLAHSRAPALPSRAALEAGHFTLFADTDTLEAALFPP